MVMGSPTWEDLGVFFDQEEIGGFGKSAVVHLRAGQTRSLVGILDTPPENPELGSFVASSCSHTFLVQANEAADLDRGDLLTIAGTQFDVIGVEVDSPGLVLVLLAEGQS